MLEVMGFAEPVIGPATSGRARWLNRSDGLALRPATDSLLQGSPNGRVNIRVWTHNLIQ